MVKGKSIQTFVQQNEWKETKVRWGVERLPIVLFRQLAVVALILILPASVVGKIAQAAGVHTLVLSHLMKVDGNRNFSLSNLESNLAHLKNHYSGTVVVAKDLKCIEVKKIAKKQ